MKRPRRERRGPRPPKGLQVVRLTCPHCTHYERMVVKVGQEVACPRCHLFEGKIRWLKGRIVR